MKVCIVPSPIGAEQNVGGIWQVIHAQGRHLPACGIEIVETPYQADIVNLHAGEIVDAQCPVVTSNHGMYWTGEMNWSSHYWLYNNPVVEGLRRAHEITVPSQWVAQCIKRDMRRTPHVIPHGINADDFAYTPDHGNYVLWAKPRVDVVSDPKPVNEVAALCQDVEFRTTYGRATENVRVIGTLPFAEFQEVLRHATVWLATTRETGDIASREAMAYGVPVVGWNWGATGELIRHRETGWLAEPGDYEGLAEGIRWCTENRPWVGRAAREDILARFRWSDIVFQYVRVYEKALRGSEYDVDVSFVVPAYNYAQYLPECIGSIQNRKWEFSYEIIVVDDCSSDNTQDVLSHFDDLIVHRHEQNMGLPMSLNTGHSLSRGKYIANLDADNLLLPGFQSLYDAMEHKLWVDVGTGPYSIKGTDRVHGGPVDVWAQLDHNNQVPSTCLIRSRSVKHLGGYRRRQLKNEDAEFWCRAMSAGVRVEKVTDDIVFEYRWHGQNKSATEGGEDDPDSPLSWNFYYPWRVYKEITPFAMLGNPPMGSWPVRAYESPHIAVVIPCGPGHQDYLMDALDSVAGQTYPNVECVVANDTGELLDVTAMGHPWVRVVDTGGHAGPAKARNIAIAHAKSPLIVPLDADDLLYPGTVYHYYQAWLQYPDSIVYGDCEVEDKPGERKLYYSGPWSEEKINREAIYQDTILFAKQWWEAIGGYPEDVRLWEDWLFGVLLHKMGIGATYIERPWGVYRHWTALSAGHSKSDGDNADFGTAAFKDKLKDVYMWIQERGEQMPCRGCGKAATRTIGSKSVRDPLPVEGEDILVEYAGPGTGSISINSKTVPGKKYRVAAGSRFTIPAGDAWMLRLAGMRQIKPEEEYGIAPSQPLPTQPPTPPRIELDQMPDSTEPPERPKITISVDVLSEIPRVNPALLKEAGLSTLVDVQNDILTGAERLRKIRGIGPSTIDAIRTFLKQVFGSV